MTKAPTCPNLGRAVTVHDHQSQAAIESGFDEWLKEGLGRRGPKHGQHFGDYVWCDLHHGLEPRHDAPTNDQPEPETVAVIGMAEARFTMSMSAESLLATASMLQGDSDMHEFVKALSAALRHALNENAHLTDAIGKMTAQLAGAMPAPGEESDVLDDG